MSIITLTTDFGASDLFVGVMKGVMLGVNREVTLVDITHEIKPQNVRQAAYVMFASFGHFPEKSIHLCIVDPGVGSERKPIIFEAGGHYFIGPDNGLFTEVITSHKVDKIYEITNPDLMAEEVSNTFHGRDIFAPAAGWLSTGSVPLDAFGPLITDPVLLDLPRPIQTAANLIEGNVIYIDHFGNAITNITLGMLENVERTQLNGSFEIATRSGVASGVVKSYRSAPDDKNMYAIIGSWNTVELFVNGGSASALHGLNINDHVEARFY